MSSILKAVKQYDDLFRTLNMYRDSALLSVRRNYFYHNENYVYNKISNRKVQLNKRLPLEFIETSLTPPNEFLLSFIPLIKPIFKIVINTLKPFIEEENVLKKISLSITKQINVKLKDQYIGSCFIDYCESKNISFAKAAEQMNNKLKVQTFLSTYPHLSEVIANFIDNTSEYLKSILQNLENVKEELLTINFKTEEIIDIELFKGDSHIGGKFVVFIIFKDGNKFVYKPKPSFNEQLFLELLLLVQKDLGIDLHTYKILTFDEFSITEFVKRVPCKSETEIKRYFYNLGGYSLLFYLLQTVDIIGDNFISVGHVPCFIDLELLLGARLNHIGNNIYSPEIGMRYQESVVRSGILPRWIQGNNTSKDILIGGTIPYNKQKILKKSLTLNSYGIPKLIESSARFSNNEDTHLPLYNSKLYDITCCLDSFIEGFSKSYKIVLFEKQKFIDIFNRIFNNIQKQRFIFRDTAVYSKLTSDSLSPNVLKAKSPFSRLIILEHLWAAFDGFNFIEPVIDSEIKQLYNGDVPFFYVNFENKWLEDPEGMVVNRNLTELVGINKSVDLIKKLSLEDLKFQIKLIKGTHNIYLENYERFHDKEANA